MIEFYQPQSTGEWLAFASALAAVLAGLAAIFLPVRRKSGMSDRRDPAMTSALRAAGGFSLGIGLTAIILAQPLVYLAVGAGWFFTALGRTVGLLADRPAMGAGVARLAAEVVLAALPLAYVFGYIP